MEMNAEPSMEEDLEMERRLTKKLKLKKGKLEDTGDGLNFLFEGISSFSDNDLGEGEYTGGLDSETTSTPPRKKKNQKTKQDFCVDKGYFHDIETSEGDKADTTMDSETEFVESDETKKNKRRKSERECSSDDDASDMEATDVSSESGEAPTEFGKDTALANGLQSVAKYVAPHMRSRSGGDELQEYLHIRRRVRGLLNRLSESNVESITVEIFSIFQSVSRAVASQIVCEEVLASCAGGSRGNEQYAAVFAAFVAGMASMVGIDFGARLMASLAKSFEA